MNKYDLAEHARLIRLHRFVRTQQIVVSDIRDCALDSMWLRCERLRHQDREDFHTLLVDITRPSSHGGVKRGPKLTFLFTCRTDEPNLINDAESAVRILDHLGTYAQEVQNAGYTYSGWLRFHRIPKDHKTDLYRDMWNRILAHELKLREFLGGGLFDTFISYVMDQESGERLLIGEEAERLWNNGSSTTTTTGT